MVCIFVLTQNISHSSPSPFLALFLCCQKPSSVWVGSGFQVPAVDILQTFQGEAVLERVRAGGGGAGNNVWFLRTAGAVKGEKLLCEWGKNALAASEARPSFSPEASKCLLERTERWWWQVTLVWTLWNFSSLFYLSNNTSMYKSHTVTILNSALFSLDVNVVPQSYCKNASPGSFWHSLLSLCVN